jgi:hypothetical protein
MSGHKSVHDVLAANLVTIPLTQEGIRNFLKDLMVTGAFSESTLRMTLFDAVNSARMERRRTSRKGKGKGNEKGAGKSGANPKPKQKKEQSGDKKDEDLIHIDTLEAMTAYLVKGGVDLSKSHLLELGYTENEDVKIPDEGLTDITVKILQENPPLAVLFEDVVRKHVYARTKDEIGGTMKARGKEAFSNADGEYPKGFTAAFPRIKGLTSGDRDKAKKILGVDTARLTYTRGSGDVREKPHKEKVSPKSNPVVPDPTDSLTLPTGQPGTIPKKEETEEDGEKTNG